MHDKLTGIFKELQEMQLEYISKGMRMQERANDCRDIYKKINFLQRRDDFSLMVDKLRKIIIKYRSKLEPAENADTAQGNT